MPLGLWGIDQTIEERRLAAAVEGGGRLGAVLHPRAIRPPGSCLPMCMVSYAAGDGKATAGTILGSGRIPVHRHDPILSQPWRPSSLKGPRIKYGSANPSPGYSIFRIIVPNYFQFRIACARRARTRAAEYLYLGAPAIFGLLCLARRRGWRDVMPLLAMGGVNCGCGDEPIWLGLADLSAIPPCWFRYCRDWYFLAGLTLAVAPLERPWDSDHLPATVPAGRGATGLACLAIALLAGWSVRRN